MPKKVKDKVVRLKRAFREEVGKIAWVSWGSICKPKKEDGFGVISIKEFNDALLAKWR